MGRKQWKSQLSAPRGCHDRWIEVHSEIKQQGQDPSLASHQCTQPSVLDIWEFKKRFFLFFLHKRIALTLKELWPSRTFHSAGWEYILTPLAYTPSLWPRCPPRASLLTCTSTPSQPLFWHWTTSGTKAWQPAEPPTHWSWGTGLERLAVV